MSDSARCIGVDFGAESERLLLLDTRTGDELAVSVVPYPSALGRSQVELLHGPKRIPNDRRDT